MNKNVTSWCAILISVITLLYSVWEGKRFYDQLSQMSEVTQRMSEVTQETLKAIQQTSKVTQGTLKAIQQTSKVTQGILKAIQQISKVTQRTSEVTQWTSEAIQQTSEAIQRILGRLDYIEASKIDEKLVNPQAKVYLNKWRNCATSRGFVFRQMPPQKSYKVSPGGRKLVETLEKGLWTWLVERSTEHPNDRTEDILYAVNKSDLHKALRTYNQSNGTSITLETVFGILTTLLEPNIEFKKNKDPEKLKAPGN